jgi:hypothetical protein
MGKVRGTKDWPDRGGYPRQRAIELEHEGAWLLPASLRRKGAKCNHWDLCFVYEVKVLGMPRNRAWWSEYRFVSSPELRTLKIGRGHRDILKEAGYA